MAHMYIHIHCYMVSGAVLHGMQHMQLAHQPLRNHNLKFVETWNIITNFRKKFSPGQSLVALLFTYFLVNLKPKDTISPQS